MKTTTYMKLSASILALMAAAISQVHAQATGWTGGSSFYTNVTGAPVTGDNLWDNAANWSNGLPDGTVDVSVGLATMHLWYTRYACAGPGASPDTDWCEDVFQGARPTSWDTILLTGVAGSAKNLYIGLSGGRGFQGSAAGPGHLVNQSGLTVVQNMVVGETGTGIYEATGTTTVDGNLVIGGQGIGTVTNSNTMTVGGDLTVGGYARGTLTNTSTVEVRGNTTIGHDAQGTFANTGGTVTLHGSLTVGESTQGTVNNDNGTITVVGNTSIGENVAGIGTVTNNGTVINHGRLLVGGLGRGWIHTAAGATTTTTGDVTVGEGGTGVGFVSVRGTMDNAGRLDIGDHGQGHMVVHDGGRVTNRESVVGREGGGKGYVLVSGANSIWDNTYSLILGSENESTGILTINNDGEVRISQGNGNLIIAEKAGSTGILNIGGLYPPTGLGFDIDSEVANYVAAAPLGQDVGSTAPEGAGTLDAAFVQFGNGWGEVNFNHTDTEADDYRFKAGFIGYGQINHYGNFTVLEGDSSAFTGNAHILGGIMAVDNVLGGYVTVDPAGTLRIGHMDGLTGDVLNDIVNNGIVQFYRANSYTYDGVISGTGAVEQIGTGTTILTGENTYTGPTNILDGTLQLGDGGTMGSIDYSSGVVIGADGTLAFNRSDIKVFDRIIAGTGAIAQIGTGLTRLTADSSGFTGRTRVDAGTLSVNGKLRGTVDVNDSGMIEGLGEVGTTTVHEGGAIMPGNSTAPGMQRIGTFAVVGDFTQEAGSLHKTDVLSTGESDLLHVTGAAVISNESVLDITKMDPARYELEHRYTVLTADLGVTGDYILTGDTFVSTFYRVEDHYDANNVYLDVTQHRLFPEGGRTRNQIAAATAAQELKASRDADGYPTNPLFRAVAYLPNDKQARYAFDQISGEIYASLQGAMLEESQIVRDVMGDRLRSAFGDIGEEIVGYLPGIDIKDPTPQPIYGNNQDGLVIWGRGLANWGSVDGDGNAAGLERNGGGIFVGADMPFRENFRVGLLAGYDHTGYDVPERYSTAESDNYHIGLYGGAEWWRLALQLGAGYTWHQAEVSRGIVFPGFAESAHSEFDGGTAQVYGDLGYTFPVGLPSLQFQPFLGLAYADTKQGSYDESGGYAALHSGADRNLGTGYGTLGLRAARVLETQDMQWTFHGMAAWRRAFGDIEPSATHHFDGSHFFTVYGTRHAAGSGLFKVGIDANLSDRLALGVSYAGEYNKAAELHNLRGDLNYKW